MSYEVLQTEEYRTWLEKQRAKLKKQIAARLYRASEQEHFGHVKDLGSGLAELKFNDGTRIYFTITRSEGKMIILILGGGKNGQSKDIKKAKAILGRII